MRDNLKKSFITGLFVTGPLVISIAVLVWFFQRIDSLFSPAIDALVGRLLPGTSHIPGTGILSGLVVILLVGFFARNVVGARAIAALDALIHRIPGYRTLYTTVKQLTDAFSPDNTRSFKDVVLVEYPKADSYAIGFRTGTVDRDGEPHAVVFVPTNHIYIGDVLIVPEEKAVRLAIGVEQAVRILVSAGVATPGRLSRHVKSGLTSPPAPP